MEKFENFAVFNLVFLQQMWANLAVYVDLLRTFGDIFDGKFDGIFFFLQNFGQ